VSNGARERILAAAVRLFQARGYHGVAVAEILAAADAPKGSLYHHFPLGKAAIAAAAVAFIAERVAARLAAPGPTSVLVREIAGEIGTWTGRRKGAEAGLIGALTVGPGAEEEPVRRAVAAAYDRWRKILAARLAAEGAPHPQALADLAIAALEGGLLMVRATGAAEPLKGVGSMLERLLATPDS
jgi:TetR/AcrR family transcriptional repressor of lmrAB and yxaGH operons